MYVSEYIAYLKPNSLHETFLATPLLTCRKEDVQKNTKGIDYICELNFKDILSRSGDI